MTLTIILFGVLIILELITMLLIGPAWKKSGKTFQPMLLFLLVNIVLEIVQSFLPEPAPGVIRIPDLQSLISALLITWQARRWLVFKRPMFYWAVNIVFFLCWAAEILFLERQPGSGSLFLIISSFGITLMAIEMLNRNLPQSRVPFHSNPVFLFSTGLIFYFTLVGLLEVFTYTLSKGSASNLFKTYYFYSSNSILVQLLYIRSVLCIPAKDNYYSY